MKKEEIQEATVEEVKEWLLSDEPVDPDELRWEPLLQIFKNTLRLCLPVTVDNASDLMIEAYRKYVYPPEDPPEIIGLLRAIDRACYRAGIGYNLIKGTRELHSDFISYFEPYIIDLPFNKAELHLLIIPGEIQLIMKNVKKEKPPLSDKLHVFMDELLREVREWVRNGNR